MTLLSPPFLLGAAGQLMSGRLARLSLSAAWRPAATGVQTVSGVLAGPPNTMGELALPTGTQLTVQAFRAVVQSALDATAGAYEVTNDAPVTLPVTAQHATQYRRSLVVVRVDDSQVSGVSSSPTTDRATLELLDSALAASAAATVLPTPAGSWLALGEVGIPPVGQTVTVTPYNPRTGTRHGILPVLGDTSTVPGHAGATGTHDGQYRDHPTRGLERWHAGSSAWRGSAPLRARAKVLSTTVNSVALGTDSTVGALNAVPLYDTAALWDQANRRFVLPWAGEWRVKLYAHWSGGTVGQFIVVRIARGAWRGTDLASDLRGIVTTGETYTNTQYEGTFAAGDITSFGYFASNQNPINYLGDSYAYCEYLGPDPATS